jgi:hypothetical protein
LRLLCTIRASAHGSAKLLAVQVLGESGPITEEGCLCLTRRRPHRRNARLGAGVVHRTSFALAVQTVVAVAVAALEAADASIAAEVPRRAMTVSQRATSSDTGVRGFVEV